MMYRTAFALAFSATLLAGGQAKASDADDAKLVLRGFQNVCDSRIDTPVLPDAELIDRDHFELPNGEGVVAGWAIKGDRRLQVTKIRGQGRMLVFVDLFADRSVDKPLLRAGGNGRCDVIGGRRIVWGPVDGKDQPLRIENLGPSMQPDGKVDPLNPEPTTGSAKAQCVRVGILDNGVNYVLPEIAKRLARDPGGRMIGYDFWDDDGRPFDYGVPPDRKNPQISLFRPNRHGTMVASVLIDYLPPTGCIVPVRYPPFSDGDEVLKAVQFMKKAGVKVVSLQSSRRQPWPAFETAIRQNPEMLFVVAAGNDGADMNDQPLYPTVYKLPNILVVGGVDARGATWDKSNSGSGIVDVAVLTTNVPVTKFDGSTDALSGTSFAAPKVAGYAAKLLARHGDMDGRRLHEEIVGAARKAGDAADGVPILTESIIK